MTLAIVLAAGDASGPDHRPPAERSPTGSPPSCAGPVPTGPLRRRPRRAGRPGRHRDRPAWWSPARTWSRTPPYCGIWRPARSVPWWRWCSPIRRCPGRTAVREERGQVVDAGAFTPLAGDPTGVFGGALRVGVADLPTLAARGRRAGYASRPRHRPGRRRGAAAGDRRGRVRGLGCGRWPRVRRGPALRGSRGARHPDLRPAVRLLVAHRVEDPAGLTAAEAAVTAVDEDRAELRLSVKEKDDFFSTYFVSTWSPYLVRLSARLPAHPDRGDGDLGALRVGRGGAVRGRWAARAGRWRGAALPGLRAGLRGRPTGPLHPATSAPGVAGWTRWRTGPRSTWSTPGWASG